MRKLFLTLTTLFIGLFILASQEHALAEHVESNIVVYEDFEATDEFESIEKLYSEFGFITSEEDEVISGVNSLKLQTTFPQGTYTPALFDTEKDVIEISGPNSYTLSMKLKVYSFQALMIEVRNDWETNSLSSMPYEFGLFIDENAKTVSRRGGWIPLDKLPTYNESYSMDENGIISLSFTFVSEKPAVIEIKGQTGNEDFGYLVIDEFKLEKGPRFSENFENLTGNFWDASAFWANSGNLTNLENEAINDTSLKYTYTDNDPVYNVALGGITNTEFAPAVGINQTISFNIKALDGAESFVFVAQGAEYKELMINLLDGTHSGNWENVEIIDRDTYYEVKIPYTTNSIENYEFKFFGGGALGQATGVVIDDFTITVEDTKFHLVPVLNTTYDKALKNALSYQIDITSFEIRNELDEVVENTNYTLDNGILTLSSTYLSSLEVGEHTYKVKSSVSEKEFTFVIIDSNPEVTTTISDYEKSLALDLNLTVDLKDSTLTKITIDETDLTDSNYVLNENILTIKGSFLKTLDTGSHNLTLTTEKGSNTVTFTSIEGRTPIVDETNSFTKGTDIDVEITLNLPIDVITKIKYGEQELDATNYLLENGTLTLKSEYLNTLLKGNQQFTIVTDNSEFTLTVEISAVSPTVNGEATKEFVNSDITFNIDTKGLPITKVLVDGAILADTNYSFSDGVLTIKASYLNTKGNGNLSFTVETEGGEVELTVTIDKDEEPTTTTTDEQTTTTKNTPTQSDKDDEKKSNIGLYIVLAILGIGLIGLVPYFVKKRK